MDSVKHLCQELESILSNINSSGFDKIDPTIIEKLEKMCPIADELGMHTGKNLINNFTEILKSFIAGKANANSVSLRFTALEFYEKNILGNQGDGTEENL